LGNLSAGEYNRVITVKQALALVKRHGFVVVEDELAS
jgi:hypothetical protein